MEGNDDSIDWPKVILSLNAFTKSLVESKTWFRKKSGSYIGGKEIEDYVNEAIARFIEEANKFDPQRGTLLNYLKFNLIRMLVSNDVKLKENRVSSDLSVFDDSEEENADYSESIQPYIEAYFDEEIDYNNVASDIEAAIQTDQLLQKIYTGICSDLKRRENH